MSSLLAHTPTFDAAAAVRLAREHYGLAATATPLPGERDQNFQLQTEDGRQYVLKIANAREDPALLAAQHQVLAHLAQHTALCQQVRPTLSGATSAPVQAAGGATHQVWLVTYLPGVPLGAVRRRTPALLADLGRSVAQVGSALADFDHPAIHRRFHWDLLHGVEQVRQQAPAVADVRLRALVTDLADDFARRAAPLLAGLPRRAVHNDANDYNVLVGDGPDLAGRRQRVTGIIDFGDMVYSVAVADLAVAVAYAILDAPDPLVAAAQVVAGYHQAAPLQEKELAVLFDLARLRLCLSVCLGAVQQAARPQDPYLAISQAPIARTLPRLAHVHRRLAAAVFRHACGLPPAPAGPAVVAWLQARDGRFAPLLPPDRPLTSGLVFDLSVASPLVAGAAADNEVAPLGARLQATLDAAGAAVGVGRYDEPRLIYTAPMFAAGPGPLAPRRTVHLGLDLFAPAGTPVHAPLAGAVHAVADNTGPQDYGPVLLLRHQTDAGQPFYTLYGHLSRASLAGLAPGTAVAAGQPLAALGEPAENGGWPPHLHFQLIIDLLDLDTDFPGVAPAGQRDVWRSLSPDPNLIAGVPADRFPPPAPDGAATLAARRRWLGPSLRLSYREPLKIVRGWMQYLYDESGRRYLDAYNNVPHVGHAHPRVVAAGQAQMGILNTNTRYLHDTIHRLAAQLCAQLPPPLTVCHFVNSGSEANELALRLARAYTGQRDLIVLAAAYHGHTSTLIDISPYKHDGPGGDGPPPWVHAVPLPDDFRGPYRRGEADLGPRYAAHVGAVLDRLPSRGVAGFIAESLPSVGGQIVLPPGYLAAVYRQVRAAGGVCIADEVQTGYGRVGTHFWGFAAQDVAPDIVVLGKPMGNGHPLAAVVTTPEIAAAFDNGMEFFSTFGGNPVSCAVGLAVLETVLAEGLQVHALAVGARLLAGLRPLRDRYPIVGDVRGSGLFLGVELVRDRQTLAPAGPEAAFIVNEMRRRGVLMGTDGPDHNVLKIRPPMPFSADDADLLLATLDQVLAADFAP